MGFRPLLTKKIKYIIKLILLINIPYALYALLMVSLWLSQWKK